MIEVRDQAKGVLVTDGTIENFRGWPLTTREAAVLVQRLLANEKVEAAWCQLGELPREQERWRVYLDKEARRTGL
jgi:hypothetical protein